MIGNLILILAILAGFYFIGRAVYVVIKFFLRELNVEITVKEKENPEEKKKTGKSR